MGLADSALKKVISKKLLVWILSTVMFFVGMIEPQHWYQITMLWMGGVSIIDVVDKLAKKPE